MYVYQLLIGKYIAKKLPTIIMSRKGGSVANLEIPIPPVTKVRPGPSAEATLKFCPIIDRE